MRFIVEAVFFDNNGTLLDDLTVAYGSVRAIYAYFGISPPTLEVYREEITSDYMRFYHEHSLPGTTPDQLNVIRELYYKGHWNECNFRDDVKFVAETCRFIGLKTAIVSAETDVLNQQLREAGLYDCFDVVRPKAWPKMQALVETAEKLGVNCSKTMYVDDTVDGLMQAKQVGIIPVGFINDTGYNSEKRIRQVTQFCIRELKELFESPLFGWDQRRGIVFYETDQPNG